MGRGLRGTFVVFFAFFCGCFLSLIPVTPIVLSLALLLLTLSNYELVVLLLVVDFLHVLVKEVLGGDF